MEILGVVLLAAVVTGLLLGLVLRRRQRRRLTGPAEVAATPAAVPPGERLRRSLAATRRRFGETIEAALGRASGDVDLMLGELEQALVGADVGVRTTGDLIDRLRKRIGRSVDANELRGLLAAELELMLAAEPPVVPSQRPWVVLVTGVNGVGKTTTIGKLAALHAGASRRVLLVAADTFRAAAIDQLAVWAERTGAGLVRQVPGASPAAVAFDGIKAAMARDVDIVLIDTAGRLHTRSNLMDELRKVRRVVERELPGAPHETLLVLDATTGQNAVAQARTFAEAVEITGVILTKLDGTARGGVAFAVRHDVGVPIRYLGVGEGVDDLRPFDAHQFVEALLAREPVGVEASRFP